MINAALIVGKGEFRDFKSAGKQFYRYPHMLYTLMRNNKRGIKVDGIEATTLASVGKSVSIFSEGMMHDFSKYDVIHSPDLTPLFPIRKGHAARIATAHDFQFVFAPQYNVKYSPLDLKGNFWQNFMINLSLKSMLSADYIIAVSTNTKKDAARLGFDKNKIFVVNHGIDNRYFKPVPKKNHKVFTVGSLGGIGLRKNVAFGVRAFRMIKEPGYKFDIWGGTFWYNDAHEQAQGDDRIKFMGYAPDDKMVDIYDSFDVMVQPAFYEGFSITIIEAQARGVPVIIYKKGIIPDEVKKYCLVAEDEQEMAEMIINLKKNGYNEKKRKEAMQYARGFTWEKTADRTLDVYEKVAGKG